MKLLTISSRLTTPNPAVISVVESDAILLPQFVDAAHKNVSSTLLFEGVIVNRLHIDQKVKAKLSIGGWTGSRWFSSNVGSAPNRTAFVKSVTGLVRKYKLDGVDFEYVDFFSLFWMPQLNKSVGNTPAGKA